MWIFRLSALLLFLQMAGAVSSPADWGDSVSGDLHWGENLSQDGYRLVAADFSRESSNPSVLLRLYRGNEPLMELPLKPGENFTFDDTVAAEVDSIFIPDSSEGYDEPRARVMLRIYSHPDILLHLVSDKDSYDPGDEIRLSLVAENQGTEDATGIKVDVSSKPQLFRFDDGISKLKAGSSSAIGMGGEQEWIRLKAPLFPGPAEFQLKAKAKYSDDAGKEFESAGYCTIYVSGQVSLHKRTEENMLPGKRYPVILSLRNFGVNTVKVELSDFIANGFVTNSSLKWKIDVGPGKTEIVSYDVVPERPGAGFVLPAATAVYDLGNRHYESRSESPSVDVSGPFLTVEKRISSSRVKPGEAVFVSIDITNAGNRTLKVALNETIPSWARPTGGQTALSQTLVVGEAASLSYRISCSRTGRHEIPETAIVYADSRGDEYRVNSSSLSLEVVEEKREKTPINKSVIDSSVETKSSMETRSAGKSVPQQPESSMDSSRHSSISTRILILSAFAMALIYFLLGKID
jgi:hypothetical protein